MTIFEKVKAAGIQFDAHETDLYVPVCAATRKLVDEYEHKANVTMFEGQADGASWYDIPFAYDPAWEARLALRRA